MDVAFADRVTHHPPASVLPRMVASMWRQGARAARCPAAPRIDGQLALVTGGGRGIGLETSRGLAARGAEVVLASRGEAAGKAAAEALASASGRPAHFVPLDLADLASLPRTFEALDGVLAGRRLDVFVANAGLWPVRYAHSLQGHEIAFATNVLGHHALLRGLQDRGALADGARVVFVTGDIYVMASACTEDFVYAGPLGGQLAYCRSKLGNLWQARELARRHPELRVHAVHPGVVATDLGGSAGGLAARVKRVLMIPPEAGAQTTLFCVTQPGLESGSYWHNTLGRMELRPADPGAAASAARVLWERLEELVRS
jgi:NAD(P)-dependent dehydrogenase (short-subunit alcohol dehydrogenase family)